MRVTFPTNQLIAAHRKYSFENQNLFQILNNENCHTRIRRLQPRIESLQTPFSQNLPMKSSQLVFFSFSLFTKNKFLALNR